MVSLFSDDKNNKWMSFIHCIDLYHGYATDQLQRIADQKDESIVKLNVWNSFVEYADSIAHKYVCFISVFVACFLANFFIF